MITRLSFFFFLQKYACLSLERGRIPFARLQASPLRGMIFRKGERSAIFFKATGSCNSPIDMDGGKIPGKTFSIITLKRMQSYVISLQFQHISIERKKTRFRIARVIFIG